MIDDEILLLRRKLNESIKNKENYKEIYKLSVELDKLITKYYSGKLETNNKKTK